MRQNKMVRALFPGTFDPIHYGHMDIAERASRLFDEVVMAVYDKPLKSLMFSPEERMELVRESFKDNPEDQGDRLQRPDHRVCPPDRCPGDRARPARVLGF
jgi:cytidyltransferase-like protein